MRENRQLRWIAAAGFAVVLGVMAAPGAQALTVNAFVVRQSCINGDFVAVTMSATVHPYVRVRYLWDFNSDGIFDTGLLLSPTVTHRYHDEVMRTARVMAVNTNGVRAFDTVTFRTRRCGGGG